jgi:hypothetical protein
MPSAAVSKTVSPPANTSLKEGSIRYRTLALMFGGRHEHGADVRVDADEENGRAD